MVLLTIKKHAVLTCFTIMSYISYLIHQKNLLNIYVNMYILYLNIYVCVVYSHTYFTTERNKNGPIGKGHPTKSCEGSPQVPPYPTNKKRTSRNFR